MVKAGSSGSLGSIRNRKQPRRRPQRSGGIPAPIWRRCGSALRASVALSRSAFYERFTRAVGLAPMAYLQAWRMALAKDLLKRQSLGIAEVAERVGYGSASTFSTAFSRHVGAPPGRYARAG